MVTAVVLIKAQTDKVPELAQKMADLDGVTKTARGIIAAHGAARSLGYAMKTSL